jgi:hypothetical protein
MVHPARPLGADFGDERLAELHPVPDGVDGEAVVEAVRLASRISDPGLLTIVDVGLANLGGQQTVYVVTGRWDEGLSLEATDDIRLEQLARSLAGGLVALHRNGLTHGAIHRGAVRRRGDRWLLGPAGLAPLLPLELAPYRPPGLGVVEPIAPSADLWNFGIVMHEQAAGRLLRPGEQPVLPNAPRTEMLVERLLRSDPTTRPPADSVVSGDWGDGPHVDRSTGEADHWPTAPVPRPVGSSSEPLGPDLPTKSAGPGRVTLAAAAAAIVVLGGAIFAFLATGDDETGDDTTEIAADGSDQTTQSTTGADQQDDDADDEQIGGDSENDDENENDNDDEKDTDAAKEQSTYGTVNLAELAAGDCIDVDLSRGLVDTVERRPCEDGHTAEVTALLDPAPTVEEYPGRASLFQTGLTECGTAFVDYVGVNEFETTLAPVTLPPTFGEWNSESRRQTVCLARSYDGATLDRSVFGGGSRYATLEGAPLPLSKIFPTRCFATDDDLVAFGRNQIVTLVACTNLHQLEVIAIEAAPLDEELRDASVLDRSMFDSLSESAREGCDEIWADIEDVSGLPEPSFVYPVIPDEVDWQLGDRLMTCVAEWEEPVVGSAIVNAAIAESANDTEDQDG